MKTTAIIGGVVLLTAAAVTGCTATEERESVVPDASEIWERDREVALALVECLEEEGWEVTLEDNNGISWEGSAEQGDAFNTAMSECNAPLQEDILLMEDFTDEHWEHYYAMEQETAECLRQEGFDIPEIPSLQVFIDRAQSDDPWTSWGFVPTPNQSEWNRLNQVCPQPAIW